MTPSTVTETKPCTGVGVAVINVLNALPPELCALTGLKVPPVLRDLYHDLRDRRTAQVGGIGKGGRERPHRDGANPRVAVIGGVQQHPTSIGGTD